MKYAYVLSTALLFAQTAYAQAPAEDPDPVPRPAFSLGSERVDPFAGSFSTTIPVEVPKFHGIEPAVSLSYNSSSGNGYVGVGWTLKGPTVIERATPGKGSPGLGQFGAAMEDVFLLDGQELMPCATAPSSPSCLAGGTHATRVETYQRIRHETVVGAPGDPASDGWNVWKKDGTRSTYVPIFEVTGALNGTVRWGLRSVQDTRGNQVVYGWQCSSGLEAECYPYRISYAKFLVDFYWEARPDTVTYASGGGEVMRMTQRLQEIRVFSGGDAELPMVRAYQLSYALSGATQRSILTRVQEVGKDTNIRNWNYTQPIVGGTRAPPMTVQIPSTVPAAPPSFGAGQSWGAAPILASWSAHWFGDFNGDGRADLLFVPGTMDGYYVMLSQGSCQGNATPCGFAPAKKWANYAPISDWRSVFVADLDQDGKDDLMYRSADATGFYAAISTGNDCPSATECGFRAPANWASDVAPTMLDPLHPVDQSALWLRDVDGDGRPDLLYVSAVPSIGIFAKLNSGSGFSGPQLLASVPATLPQSAKWVYPGDYNGDGKTDLMYVSSGLSAMVMLSSGSALLAPRGWGDLGATPHASAVRVADFNGDGRADLLVLSGLSNSGVYSVMLSGGAGFSQARGWANYEGLGNLTYDLYTTDVNHDGRADLLTHVGSEYRARLSDGSSFAGAARVWGTRADVPHLGAVWIQDFTGDGQADLLQLSGSTNTFILAENEAPEAPDLVHAIGNGLGGSQSLTYARSNRWSRANAAPFTQTVLSTVVSDGRGHDSTTRFQYEGARYDHRERRFLGFRRATRTLPCIDEELACPYEELSFRQDLAAAGRPLRTERRSGDGTLLSVVEYEYTTGGDLPPYAALESRRSVTELFGNQSRTSRTEATYDAFGNKLFEFILGDLAVSGDERTVRTLFRPNLTNYVVELPAARDAFSGVGTAGALIEQTLFYYDQPAGSADGSGTWDAPPGVGNLTESARWISTTGGFASSRKEYDTYGNVIRSIDEGGAATRMVFDNATHTFERERRNALGHYISTGYDVLCGLPNQVTDVNGQTVTTDYDGLCRPRRKLLPAGGFIDYHYESLGDATLQRLRIETPGPFEQGNLWREIYFDGLGRTYRKMARGPSLTRSIVDRTEYNARGKEALVSEAHYAGESGRTRATRYDALDRPLVVQHADGTEVRHSYGLGTMTTIDEAGHRTISVEDVFGKQVQDQDFIDGAAVITNYLYDERQNLVGIRDHAGNAWNYQYDSLGRRLVEDDPDLGRRTYSYDDAGRPVLTVDALGQRTEVSYDVLGRPRTKRVRAGAANEALTQRFYDEQRLGQFNVGKLTHVQDAGGDLEIDYDAAGRWQRRARTIDGQTFLFERSYDGGGRLLWQTFPDGDVLGTPAAPLAYDEAGRLRSIPGIVAEAQYEADGKLSLVSGANGTLSTRSYSRERGWLTHLRTTAGAAVIQDLSYSFDAEGKLRATASPFENEAWSYGYDELHRLTVARDLSSPQSSESFAYDALGRMVESSRVGCYAYPPAGSPRPHAPTQAGALSLSYDANGNLSARGGVPLTWDGENHLLSMGADTFVYDADGERLKRTTGGVTTLYPGEDYEVGPSGVATKYFKLGATAVAKRVGNTTYWLHTDHLGSIQASTSGSGKQVQRLSYRPYGADLGRRTGHEESRSYIGANQDGSGLIYLHARYYDPSLGLFASADPTWPLKKGVGLQRYAYSGNDPVNRLDPGGDVFFLALLPAAASAAAPYVTGAVSSVAVGALLTGIVEKRLPTTQEVIKDATIGAAGIGVLSAAAKGVSLLKSSEKLYWYTPKGVTYDPTFKGRTWATTNGEVTERSANFYLGGTKHAGREVDLANPTLIPAEAVSSFKSGAGPELAVTFWKGMVGQHVRMPSEGANLIRNSYLGVGGGAESKLGWTLYEGYSE